MVHCSLMARDSNCNQMRHSYSHLNAGIRLKWWGIPPVNTVPQAGWIKSLWGKRRGLRLSVFPSIPPVNTAPTQGSLIKSLWQKRQAECWDQHSTPHFTNQHRYHTWQSDQKLVEKKAGLWDQCNTSISLVTTAPTQGSEVKRSWGKKRGLELGTLPSISPGNTAPTQGSQIKSLGRKRRA